MRRSLAWGVMLLWGAAGMLGAQQPVELEWPIGALVEGSGPRAIPAALVVPLPVGATWTMPASARGEHAEARPAITGQDVLVAALFVVGTVAIAPVDRHFAERLQHPRNQENRLLRIPAEALNLIAFPGSFIIGSGLYLHGVIRDDRETAALGLHGLEALLIGSGIATVIKGTVGRARPYLDVTDPLNFRLWRGWANEQYRSFPSGHTVAGFAAATVVTRETSLWWPGSEDYIGPVMYLGATLIGVSRMYTNNHWASDVVMGAAIGTLAGVAINRFHRDDPDNWIDRELLPDESRESATPLAAPRYIVLWSVPMPR